MYYYDNNNLTIITIYEHYPLEVTMVLSGIIMAVSYKYILDLTPNDEKENGCVNQTNKSKKLIIVFKKYMQI